MGGSLTKRVFYGKNGVRVYLDFKKSTKLYTTSGEVKPLGYIDRRFHVKAVLQAIGILKYDGRTNLQSKLHDALVKDSVSS